MPTKHTSLYRFVISDHQSQINGWFFHGLKMDFTRSFLKEGR